MNEKINAMAELAERLNFDVDELNGKHKDHRGIYQCVVDDVCKASHIIAELSKVVNCIHREGTTLMYTTEERMAVISAVDKCREIAEEGVGCELNS